jgi:two-component system NtrC family sensor kinase
MTATRADSPAASPARAATRAITSAASSCSGSWRGSTDLDEAVDSTLTIARNEYRYVADLVTELGALPRVQCHANEINQVILNLAINAAHAIADRNAGGDRRGTIKIATYVEGASAVIAISDTGNGIAVDLRERIFEPFFTTKEVGRGTGQGLAIARAIVVDKHGGTLSFDTEVGRGTTFYIRIPTAQPATRAA